MDWYNRNEERLGGKPREYGENRGDYRSRPRQEERFGRELSRPQRHRGEERSDLCWGRNPVLAALECHPEWCENLLLAQGIDPGFNEQVCRLCNGRVPISEVDRFELDEMTHGEVHQGVLIKLRPFPALDIDEVLPAESSNVPSLVVIMDHCKDPHNLGAVIRSAELAGAACVVCQKDRSAVVNGTVLKTSAGAAFRIPVAQVTNVVRALEALKKKGYWVAALDHRASRNIWASALPERLALVVGAENEGISPLVLKNCDLLVKLPMAGHTGSLNASVAAALGMFEWVRLYRNTEAASAPKI